MRIYRATSLLWYGLTVFIALIGVSCGREPEPAARPELAATIVVSRVTPTPAELATALPSATVTAEPTLPPPPTATVAPSSTPSPSPSATPTATLPPGLVFSSDSGLWMVSTAGEVQLLFEKQYAELSPDGNKVLYREEEDIWLADLETGEVRNLTQTPADDECCPQWWPARPDSILFIVTPENQNFHLYGFLATYNIDNGNYQIIDNESSLLSGFLALSPDGQAILYDANFPRLYRWEIESEIIDTTSWQIEPPQETLYLSSPAWSPDGSDVAWMAYLGNEETEYGQLARWGILIFDSETNVAHIAHTFLAGGTDVLPSPPSWSTDGQWIAIRESISQHNDGSFWSGDELWLVAADGSGEKVGLDIDVEQDLWYWNVAWSPDGRWLAFTPDRNEESAVWLAEVGTWQVYRVPLPGDEGVTVRDWLAVTP
jgi:Tol biopolymer transport system component